MDRSVNICSGCQKVKPTYIFCERCGYSAFCSRECFLSIKHAHFSYHKQEFLEEALLAKIIVGYSRL